MFPSERSMDVVNGNLLRETIVETGRTGPTPKVVEVPVERASDLLGTLDLHSEVGQKTSVYNTMGTNAVIQKSKKGKSSFLEGFLLKLLRKYLKCKQEFLK